MEPELICSSCKQRITNITGTAKFPCPKCAKTTIIRCRHCRGIVAKYICAECNFIGPN